MKVAVIVAPGCEEGETLTIVDIIRRAEITCDMVGLEKEVTGGHGITFLADCVLDEDVIDYDMIVLPGGYGGADAMCHNDLLISIIQRMFAMNKWVCAMCAAPIVLDKAGVLEGKHFTAYVGYDQKIKSGLFEQKIVVKDGNLITSRAPATTYAFGYALVDALGGDSEAVKKRMAYFKAFDESKVSVYE